MHGQKILHREIEENGKKKTKKKIINIYCYYVNVKKDCINLRKLGNKYLN